MNMCNMFSPEYEQIESIVSLKKPVVSNMRQHNQNDLQQVNPNATATIAQVTPALIEVSERL